MTKVAVIAVSVALLATACAGSPDLPSGIPEPSPNPGAAEAAGEEGDGSGSETDTGSEPDSGSGSEPDSGPGLDSEAENDGGGEAVVDPGNGESGLTAGLSTFDDCGSLLDHLRTEYAERIGPWGFKSGSDSRESWITRSVATDEDTADDSDPDSEATSDYRFIGAVDSSQAPQEAGVDGADLVKTDGRRIFAVSNGLLLVVDVASRQVEGSTRLASGQGTGLLLDGDDLLVILSDSSLPVRAALEPDDGSDDADQPRRNDLSVTIVQRVRVDGYEPRVVETLRMDGTYRSTRSLDGVARLVTRHHPSGSFSFVSPQGSTSEWEAEQANRAAVAASTLEDWLPSYAIIGGDGTGPPVEGGLLPACENVYVPSEFAGFGTTNVMSLPIGGPLAGDSAVSMTVYSGSVYVTPQSLYLAAPAWVDPKVFADEADWARAAEDHRNAIHRFDLTDPDRAAYASSGSVPGRFRDLLSEHDGHLRVVTTTGDLWWQQSLSQVRVLRQDGNRLVEVGTVDDIGRGERIESVRLAGAIGFVIPTRRADPLYTLDLSDPENPAIGGEFEIPDFSNYQLHHIGNDLVVGVGNDTYESTEAAARSEFSLFDLSDMADPRELDVWTAPGSWAYAIGDHPWPEGARVFIISTWANGTAQAVALRIEGSSITEIGRIDHIDPNIGPNLGSTDCRKLIWERVSEAAEPESDLWHTLYYTDTIACEPGESPAMVGFDCWPVDSVQEHARSLGVIVGDETLVSCKYGASLNMIVRSLVIGDELWTLSYRNGDSRESLAGKLAASDLATLERVALINLS